MTRALALRALIVAVLFAAIVVAWSLIVVERGGRRERTLTLPQDIQWCGEDDDCGIANQVACCPCEFGGTQGAVNRHRRPRLKAFLRRGCGDGVACVEVASCRDDLRAVCRRHRCRVVAKKKR